MTVWKPLGVWKSWTGVRAGVELDLEWSQSRSGVRPGRPGPEWRQSLSGAKPGVELDPEWIHSQNGFTQGMDSRIRFIEFTADYALTH